MLTNPENERSAEHEPSTDELLVAAIGRADNVIERVIEHDIGVEAYAAYCEERAFEDELHAGTSTDVASDLDTMKNNEVKKRAIHRAMQYLRRGFGFQKAHDLGQQDAQIEGAGETLSEASAAYHQSFEVAFGLFRGLFNSKLDNGFQLESLNGRITLSRTVDQTTQINVAYEVDDKLVKKSAFYLLASSSINGTAQPGPSRRIEVVLSESNMADGVDLVTLENDALAALGQVNAELSKFI